MSDFNDDYSDDDFTEQDSTSGSNPVRQRMKQLEKELREAKKQLADTADVQKKLAFVEAGIPLDSPMAKYFIKGYDGELSAEAIRQAAEEAQLIAPTPQVADTDKQAWRETNRIAAGSEVSPAPPGWIQRINAANSEQELMGIFAEAQAQGIDLGDL
jgi:hypothetical protein